MNMPGFSAQAALGRTRGRYRRFGGGAAMASNGRVTAQLPIGFCQANCDRIQDDFMRTVCEMQCMNQGGGGGGTGPGGGGGPVCRPKCQSCRRDPDSSTGRSKFCISRNCDDYTVEC
jgi:hypothetical protein